MKKVVFMSALAALSLSFASCKDASQSAPSEVSENTETPAPTELALANPTELASESTSKYVYVTAPSGLSLREYNNLQSNKLARMPYGTKVKVMASEGKNTMTVTGIEGAMDQVEFNHKTGYAFNGYLSEYFPPEKDITVKAYASQLQEEFPKVQYTSKVTGTTSKPINTETLVLPNAQWHEAFYTAQNLFDFPKEFVFPNPKGKDSETVFDSKPKKGIWVSQLEVTRKENELQKIMYVYGSKEFKSRVTIEKEGNALTISRTEEVR